MRDLLLPSGVRDEAMATVIVPIIPLFFYGVTLTNESSFRPQDTRVMLMQTIRRVHRVRPVCIPTGDRRPRDLPPFIVSPGFAQARGT
jgi:hypothetical protein